MKKLIKSRWRLISVFFVAAMTGCASTSQKSAATVDAWIFNQDGMHTLAFNETTLKGKSGQIYAELLGGRIKVENVIPQGPDSCIEFALPQDKKAARGAVNKRAGSGRST